MSEEKDTYTLQWPGWICFHCGEHFHNNPQGEREARLHFGDGSISTDTTPACLLKAEDKTFVKHIRSLEREIADQEWMLSRFRDEDGPKDRQMAAMQCEHELALKRKEEKGYARGLEDGIKQCPEILADRFAVLDNNPPDRFILRTLPSEIAATGRNEWQVSHRDHYGRGRTPNEAVLNLIRYLSNKQKENVYVPAPNV